MVVRVAAHATAVLRVRIHPTREATPTHENFAGRHRGRANGTLGAARRGSMGGAVMGCGTCRKCTAAGEMARRSKLRNQRETEEFFLAPRPGDDPAPDPTPLSASCPHYTYGRVPRSQCEHCIRSWIAAVGRDAATAEAAARASAGQKICAERINRAIMDMDRLYIQ